MKLIRENPEVVRQSLKKRLGDVRVVDSLLELDKAWREIKKEADDLRARRNEISEKINQAKKRGQNIDSLIREAKDIPIKIQEKEAKLTTLDERRLEIWKKIPNIIDKSVPSGDVTKNKVLKKYGSAKKSKSKEGHAEIMESLGLIDTKKAAEVSGSRFYYLRKDLVRLNYAIISFALDFLSKKGFELIQPPYMLNRKALEGAITLDVFEDAIYKIESEDLYLIGTAEHAINAFESNEVLDSKSLPLRFAGISSCFRKEAGAHGRDTKGIFRVHQFNKVEQIVICKPEESAKYFKEMQAISESIFQQLEIPYRVVAVCSGDIGNKQSLQYDIEAWFPDQNDKKGAYREVTSCSNCLEYQAVTLNTKFVTKTGERKYVHMLNNTALATSRVIAAIMGNFQTKEGTIKIPKVLWPYMNGIKEIKRKE